MCSVGNASFNVEKERHLSPDEPAPAEYPKFKFVREHFIRHKYVEDRFAAPQQGGSDDETGKTEGVLMKESGGRRGTWQKRYFVLTHGTLVLDPVPVSVYFQSYVQSCTGFRCKYRPLL